MTNKNELVIGYSGFDVFEECFEYNENACFIAGTEAAADRFNASLGPDYRIVPVTLSQIMSDYGSSLGEFAMEKEAFKRFRDAGTDADILFETETDAHRHDCLCDRNLPETASPHFSRQTSRGGPLRPPREALAGLGCVIEWDGVCISRMGGHGGPPLQIKSVQRRSSEHW